MSPHAHILTRAHRHLANLGLTPHLKTHRTVAGRRTYTWQLQYTHTLTRRPQRLTCARRYPNIREAIDDLASLTDQLTGALQDAITR